MHTAYDCRLVAVLCERNEPQAIVQLPYGNLEAVCACSMPAYTHTHYASSHPVHPFQDVKRVLETKARHTDVVAAAGDDTINFYHVKLFPHPPLPNSCSHPWPV
jgi:hypothetical protein